MKRLILICLLVTGCTSEYERKYGESKAEYERRISACDEKAGADEHVFTLVDTDRWRVGTTPFWSTSENVRATLGPPDSTFRWPSPTEFGPDLDYLFYQRSDESLNHDLTLTVINDSLAYLSNADLGVEPLLTDRGQFEPGAPLAEVREAFPESYACREWGTAGGEYRDLFYPVLAATDTARGAHVLLLFRDERLIGVGLDYYMQVRHEAPP